MKKYVLMTAAVIALSIPGLAMAQSTPGGSGGGAPPQGGPQGSAPSSGQWQQQDSQKFTEHKNMVLQRMNEHLAEVQKRISCVQAATNHEQLHACLPEMGAGGHGGPNDGHGGAQGHDFGGQQGNGGPPPQQGANGGSPQ